MWCKFCRRERNCFYVTLEYHRKWASTYSLSPGDKIHTLSIHTTHLARSSLNTKQLACQFRCEVAEVACKLQKFHDFDFESGGSKLREASGYHYILE